jgi:hypothetical protein
MVAKEKGNVLGIKGPNKGEKLKQLTSCDEKFLKDGFLNIVLKAFTTSTCSTTQLKWMLKIVQTLYTTTLHTPLQRGLSRQIDEMTNE